MRKEQAQEFRERVTRLLQGGWQVQVGQIALNAWWEAVAELPWPAVERGLKELLQEAERRPTPATLRKAAHRAMRRGDWPAPEGCKGFSPGHVVSVRLEGGTRRFKVGPNGGYGSLERGVWSYRDDSCGEFHADRLYCPVTGEGQDYVPRSRGGDDPERWKQGVAAMRRGWERAAAGHSPPPRAERPSGAPGGGRGAEVSEVAAAEGAPDGAASRRVVDEDGVVWEEF